MGNSLDAGTLASLAAVVAACCIGWAALPVLVAVLRTARVARPRPLGWLTASVAIVLSANGAAVGTPASRRAHLEPGPGRRFSETRDSAPLPPPWVRPAPGRNTPAVALRRASMPPWPESDGSSPPRPPNRAGAGIDFRAREGDSGRRTNPVSNSERRGGRAAQATAQGGWERDSSQAPSRPRNSGPTFRVREGDTLWEIAALVLGTSDAARIARYWPQIHRANREVVGPDPSLIFPGQVLRLPPEAPRQ